MQAEAVFDHDIDPPRKRAFHILDQGRVVAGRLRARDAAGWRRSEAVSRLMRSKDAKNVDVSRRAAVPRVRDDFVHDHVAFDRTFTNAAVLTLGPFARILPQILDGGPNVSQTLRRGFAGPWLP